MPSEAPTTGTRRLTEAAGSAIRRLVIGHVGTGPEGVRMPRLGRVIAVIVVTAKLVGCGDSMPPPPAGDPRGSWPAEVKEAEGKFEEQAKRGARKAP